MKKRLLLFSLLLLISGAMFGQCTITVIADPTNGGTVTGGGTYEYNTLVTIIAEANEGYSFINWTKNGSVVSTDSLYKFRVTESATYVAHFQVQSYQITAIVDPTDGGSVSGDGTYDYGETCTLTASPNEGFTFSEWKESDTVVGTDPILTFEVMSSRTFVAHFEPQQQTYTITANADPTDGGTINGSSTFTQTYTLGETCTLTASPTEGYNFSNWTENDEVVPDAGADYTFPADHNRDLVAHFESQIYTITTSQNDEDWGTVTGYGTYYYGDTAMLTAIPAEGYSFDHWDDNSTENPRYVMVTSDMSFTAFFKQIYIIIEAPDAICAGESLTLTEPQLLLPPTHTEWQLSQTNDFESYEVYNNESLHTNYNGWYLRYCAKYLMVSIYSNTVQITVNSLEGLTLKGNESVNTYQEVEYQVIDSINNYANYSYDWSLSDEQAEIIIIDNGCKVIWKTAGIQEVSVIVTDTITSCTNTYTLPVEVSSCIDGNDIHNIVAKSYANSIKYILIYPNPNPNNTYTFQWYRNDTLIQYANKQYYYKPGGLPDGNYKVRISIFKDERCSAFSPVFLVENNQNHHPSSRLSIYPNPAHSNDELFIVNGSENEAQLTIYSIDGRLLHSQTVSGSQTSINVCLPQGVYVAHISDQSGFVKVEKIIIQ